MALLLSPTPTLLAAISDEMNFEPIRKILSTKIHIIAAKTGDCAADIANLEQMISANRNASLLIYDPHITEPANRSLCITDAEKCARYKTGCIIADCEGTAYFSELRKKGATCICTFAPPQEIAWQIESALLKPVRPQPDSPWTSKFESPKF